MKRLVTAVVVTLSLTLLPFIPASAAVKAGAICTKLNVTTTLSGYKYTCIKSGKKLVWSKGVKVVVAKPTPTPTPSPTPTPTPSPTPTPTPSPTPTSVYKVGDICFAVGEKIVKDGNRLECRGGSNGSKTYFEFSEIHKDVVNTALSQDLSVCRIPDSRLKITQTLASIAYPTTPRDPSFTSLSNITIAILPIDFSDAVGAYSPNDEMNAIIKESEEWTKWYTNGRLKITWVLTNKWVRAPGLSADYDWTHPSSNVGSVDNNQQFIGTNLVKIADSSIDLSKVQEIYFMYPKDITKIKDSVNFTNDFQTSKGLKTLGVYARSQWIDNSNINLTTWLMHENIHRFGYAQHSPAYPGMFSIAASDNSKSVGIWDRLVLDWLNPADIYCSSIESLKSEEITLVPQEREQNGFKGIAIRINNHKLLILESHRKDKWSPLFTDGLYGVTAMLIDTNFDTDRSGEWSLDDGKGIKYSRTANFLQFTQYDHGRYTPGPMVDAWPMNYLLYPGESFTYEGVKVSFTASGDNDTLKVEKL